MEVETDGFPSGRADGVDATFEFAARAGRQIENDGPHDAVAVAIVEDHVAVGKPLQHRALLPTPGAGLSERLERRAGRIDDAEPEHVLRGGWTVLEVCLARQQESVVSVPWGLVVIAEEMRFALGDRPGRCVLYDLGDVGHEPARSW
ncbi:MAG: hypothetical protein ACLPVY_12800 [Acidimicrobiia bacterium]